MLRQRADELTEASENAEAGSPLRRWVLPSWAQRKRIVHWQAVALVAVCYPLLAFVHLLPEDFADQRAWYVLLAWGAFMVRTFTPHLGLLLAAVAAVSLLVRRWKLALAAVPLLAVTLGPVGLAYLPRSAPAAEGEPLTVMSMNLLATNDQAEAALAEIRRAGADVLLLQEYSPRWHDRLGPALSERFPHARFQERRDSFGAALYSRLPLAEPVEMHALGGEGAMLGRTPQMRAVVEHEGRRLAIYNVHLLPPVSLTYVTARRARFAALLERLRGEELAAVVAGDFNFTGRSGYADALGELGYTDAHTLAGRGRGATWPVHGFMRYLPVPHLRIDHVYLSRELTAVGARTGIGAGSDHRPIVVEVGWAE